MTDPQLTPAIEASRAMLAASQKKTDEIALRCSRSSASDAERINRSQDRIAFSQALLAERV